MPGDESASDDAVSSENQLDRYDLVLAAVPVCLGAGAAGDALLGGGAWITAGAATSVLAVGYGLFGDPPGRENGNRAR